MIHLVNISLEFVCDLVKFAVIKVSCSLRRVLVPTEGKSLIKRLFFLLFYKMSQLSIRNVVCHCSLLYILKVAMICLVEESQMETISFPFLVDKKKFLFIWRKKIICVFCLKYWYEFDHIGLNFLFLNNLPLWNLYIFVYKFIPGWMCEFWILFSQWIED